MRGGRDGGGYRVSEEESSQSVVTGVGTVIAIAGCMAVVVTVVTVLW